MIQNGYQNISPSIKKNISELIICNEDAIIMDPESSPENKKFMEEKSKLNNKNDNFEIFYENNKSLKEGKINATEIRDTQIEYSKILENSVGIFETNTKGKVII